MKARISAGASLLLFTACVPAVLPRPTPVDDQQRWVEQTLASLSLREKVAQMVVPRVGGEYLPTESDTHDRLRDWIATRGIGGVIIGRGAPLEVAARLNLLQGMAKVPLLVSADMESGPGGILRGGVFLPGGGEVGGATQFPPLMAFGAAGDERLVYEMGRITAREGRAVGVHMTYAPVVDVNNNPNNPIINTRSYGEQPPQAGRLAAAHIRGLQENGMLATAKHFPGHGDTGTDSHIDLPVISVDRARANAVELPPFRAALDAGVAGIMSAHIAFPALTGDTTPATLSPKLLTGLLQEELGFRGLVVTDALDMGGIVRRYGNAEAPVLAVKAGADVLLMPPDVPLVIESVVGAVQRGEIPESRIDHSVRKLLAAKAGLGLHRERTVRLDSIPATLGLRSHLAVAQRVAERSITLVRDQKSLLPLDSTRTRRVLSIVYTDDVDPYAGRTLQRSLAARFPRLRTAFLDTRTSPVSLDSLLAAADSADVVLFSPFVRVLAYKGDVAIAPGVAAFVSRVAARHPTVVTPFGNPYVLSQFSSVGSYLLAWGQQDAAQLAAVRALTGEIPITGKLPISLPPYHTVGTGIQRPALRGATR